jgi:uncharacterized protein
MKISWVNEKVKAKKSKIQGTGVFALKNIAKGEVVTVFGGFVVHLNELNKIRDTNPRTHETIVSIGYQIDDKLVYAPTSHGQFSDVEYLNHSCEPNCGFISKIDLIAICDIRKGEELTMDYGLCISNKLFEMTCNCNKESCRKKITANDWKIPSLQKKLGAYFQPYLKLKFGYVEHKYN